MSKLLVIDDDLSLLDVVAWVLRDAGYEVVTASSGVGALGAVEQEPFDLVVADLRLPDLSGLDILERVRARGSAIPFLIVTGFPTTSEAVLAMRLGAADFVEKPLLDDGLLQIVRKTLEMKRNGNEETLGDEMSAMEAHAATRWARVVAPIIDAPKDPRTLTGWSRLVFVSPGALRNWCRTAGLPARRSLVFARLLRAVYLGQRGTHKLEDLLDVVDRRTLVGLLKYSGLDPDGDLPRDPEDFLQRQTLVRHPDGLREIRRAIAARWPTIASHGIVNRGSPGALQTATRGGSSAKT